MTTLDKATVRELAVQASVDPRTIEKVLAGEPVRGMALHRARAVLVAAGHLPAPQLQRATVDELLRGGRR